MQQHYCKYPIFIVLYLNQVCSKYWNRLLHSRGILPKGEAYTIWLAYIYAGMYYTGVWWDYNWGRLYSGETKTGVKNSLQVSCQEMTYVLWWAILYNVNKHLNLHAIIDLPLFWSLECEVQCSFWKDGYGAHILGYNRMFVLLVNRGVYEQSWLSRGEGGL